MLKKWQSLGVIVVLLIGTLVQPARADFLDVLKAVLIGTGIYVNVASVKNRNKSTRATVGTQRGQQEYLGQQSSQKGAEFDVAMIRQTGRYDWWVPLDYSPVQVRKMTGWTEGDYLKIAAQRDGKEFRGGAIQSATNPTGPPPAVANTSELPEEESLFIVLGEFPVTGDQKPWRDMAQEDEMPLKIQPASKIKWPKLFRVHYTIDGEDPIKKEGKVSKAEDYLQFRLTVPAEANVIEVYMEVETVDGRKLDDFYLFTRYDSELETVEEGAPEKDTDQEAPTESDKPEPLNPIEREETAPSTEAEPTGRERNRLQDTPVTSFARAVRIGEGTAFAKAVRVEGEKSAAVKIAQAERVESRE